MFQNKLAVVKIHQGSLCPGSVLTTLTSSGLGDKHIPAWALKWPRVGKQSGVDSVEEGKIGVDLKDPIRLHEDDGTNV